MGGQKHQPVLGHLGKQIAEADPLLRVKTHRRLVENQEMRIAQDGLRDSHPLALSAGQSADFRFLLLLQIGTLDRGGDGLLAVVDSFQRRHVVQKLPDRQLVKQSEGLGQIAQAGFQQPLLLHQGLSVYRDRPLCGEKARHQELHQGGLPRSVRPQQADEVWAAQVQIDSPQGGFPRRVCHG